MPKRVLALDISTAIIGWACVEPGDDPLGVNLSTLRMGHVDLRKLTGMWTKLDAAEKELAAVIESFGSSIDAVYVEDPVERFRTGLSSAHTIATLARFNVLVSAWLRRVLELDPRYIDATQARRAIGVPLLSKKKANGLNQKEQTFRYLCDTVFKGVEWSRNRTGKIQPWCYDECDAFVISVAGTKGLGRVL
jgi:hypothetical protein